MTLRRSVRLLSKLTESGPGPKSKRTEPIITNRTITTRARNYGNGSIQKVGKIVRARKRLNERKISASTKKVKTVTNSKKESKASTSTLPRTQEQKLLLDKENSVTAVMGVDEAGRGPLAGPVVAAAVIQLPSSDDNQYPVIEGITDSKKITKEEHRQELYDQLTACPNILYAVAIVDAACIDEINILQATYKAMRLAACGVLGLKKDIRYESDFSIEHNGCYVVVPNNNDRKRNIAAHRTITKDSTYALIDGNRLPSDFPCLCEPMVKGDGREYIIGAASIFAKVARDNLMRDYDKKFPQYLLQQHKGYPTAKHMALVHKYGPSPIHRLTFAPLKHMDLSNFQKS